MPTTLTNIQLLTGELKLKLHTKGKQAFK